MSKKKKQGQEIHSKVNKNTIIFMIIVILGFLLYGNSIPNKYALDDVYVVTGNKYTKQGFAGIDDLIGKHFFAGYFEEGAEVYLAGGRYRPLSMVSLAIEYAFFGENPHFSHFINVVLFVMLCILLFIVLMMLSPPPPGRKWYLTLPFLATLIFLAHPVHTEVVANIKGRDEILALLFSLLALLYLLKYTVNRSKKLLVYAFIAYFLGLMSKEIAAVFLVLIPLSMYYFNNQSVKKLILPLVSLLAAIFLFALVRQSALAGLETVPSDELMDNPFVGATLNEKFATIIYTLGLYIKLLFIPHPLTWDYYPYHISLKTWSDPLVIASLLAYLFMIISAVIGFFKKKIWSYIIVVYLVALAPVSNIVFPVGTFMAERFLFIPSIAFCLLIAWILSEKSANWPVKIKKYLLPVFSLIMLLYAVRTISRNDDWKDDFTLYSTDVKVSSNSARSNQITGAWYSYLANQPENAGKRIEYFDKSESYLRKAISIHPKYQQALFQMGNLMHDYRQNDDSTMYYYYCILKLNPNEENVFRNISLIMKSKQDTAFKRRAYMNLKAINPGRPEVAEIARDLGISD